MSRNMYCMVSVLGALFATALPGTASAQWHLFGDPCRRCCTVPVCQPCYQTVPVTEIQEVRQVVQRPVVETNYVKQDYTVFDPVEETRTASIPTVSYDCVTENRAMTRDCGRWVSHRVCRPRVSPCQYDPRPTFAGWLNRTGYQIRSTFTPRVVTRRQYVPNVVTYNVPVTRQVARHEVRQQAYKVTRMVPRTVTREVPVRTVRYVPQEIVRKVPRTVYRTVPIGSAMAYGSNSLRATADPISGRSSRSASRRNSTFRDDNYQPQKFNRRDRDSRRDDFGQPNATKRTSHLIPVPQHQNGENELLPVPTAGKSQPAPTVVQVGRWTERRSAARSQDETSLRSESPISVADSTSRRR